MKHTLAVLFAMFCFCATQPALAAKAADASAPEVGNPVLLAAQSTSKLQKSREVVVYNWSEYIPSDVLSDFTRETGIKVVYSTYESNEAMYAKLKLLRGREYDVVCPSSYVTEQMVKDGLLRKLDHSKLPELKNIDPNLLSHPHDPNAQYSVPYMWGTVGLIINTKYVPTGSVSKWSDLLRPEFKGKVMLTDDARDAFGLALKSLGKSANATKESEIEEAYNFLVKLHDSVRVFDITAAKQAFVSEEVIIGTSWNGDALVAKEENENLEYIYPEEGTIIWVDSFAITSGAPNPENAHAFINFMLRPEISKRCLDEYLYSSPNLKTLELLDDELRKNRTLNPTAEDLLNSEILISIGAAQPIYERYWEKFKTIR